jgi:hypothetical protein
MDRPLLLIVRQSDVEFGDVKGQGSLAGELVDIGPEGGDRNRAGCVTLAPDCIDGRASAEGGVSSRTYASPARGFALTGFLLAQVPHTCVICVSEGGLTTGCSAARPAAEPERAADSAHEIRNWTLGYPDRRLLAEFKHNTVSLG